MCPAKLEKLEGLPKWARNRIESAESALEALANAEPEQAGVMPGNIMVTLGEGIAYNISATEQGGLSVSACTHPVSVVCTPNAVVLNPIKE